MGELHPGAKVGLRSKPKTIASVAVNGSLLQGIQLDRRFLSCHDGRGTDDMFPASFQIAASRCLPMSVSRRNKHFCAFSSMGSRTSIPLGDSLLDSGEDRLLGGSAQKSILFFQATLSSSTAARKSPINGSSHIFPDNCVHSAIAISRPASATVVSTTLPKICGIPWKTPIINEPVSVYQKQPTSNRRPIVSLDFERPRNSFLYYRNSTMITS